MVKKFHEHFNRAVSKPSDFNAPFGNGMTDLYLTTEQY